jgi:hypothetical protein
VLIIGPGSGQSLDKGRAAVVDWLKAGGRCLAVGATADDLKSLGGNIEVRPAEYISAYFEPQRLDSPLKGVGSAEVHNRHPQELPLISGGATVVGNGVLAHAQNNHIVLCQLAPWTFADVKQPNLKKTFRRSTFLVTRLAANMGVGFQTPLVERFHSPPDNTTEDKRWLSGLYLDRPEEWDDPYRFFRW